ncbi:MAG: hypothetical protein ABW087_17190 [Candidatus Thiodiazotropha sp.]
MSFLTSLIKKGGLTGSMTATPATSATQKAVNSTNVASVATVAVADTHEENPILSTEDEASIHAWLKHIQETDPVMIADVLDKCRSDHDAYQYYLKRAKEILEPDRVVHQITCNHCIYFDRSHHPHLGYCTKDESAAIAGFWDTDMRYCEHFSHIPGNT